MTYNGEEVVGIILRNAPITEGEPIISGDSMERLFRREDEGYLQLPNDHAIEHYSPSMYDGGTYTLRLLDNLKEELQSLTSDEDYEL